MSGKKNLTNSEKPRERKPLPQAFTPLTARQAQEASVRSRNLRKQVRAQMLEKLVNELDFAEEMKKAIVSGDTDRMNLLQTAIKIIGLHHDQSDERTKPTISATAETKSSEGDNDSKTLKLQFEIVDPEPDEKE